MTTLTLTQDIRAPLEHVHHLALDIPNTPGIFPQIVRVEMLATPLGEDGLPGVGTRWRETRKIGSRTGTVDLTITERRGREAFVVSCAAFGATYDTHFQFATHDGRTRVTLTMTITPGGFFSRLMSSMMRGAMERGLREDLASLRAAAEREGGTPPPRGTLSA